MEDTPDVTCLPWGDGHGGLWGPGLASLVVVVSAASYSTSGSAPAPRPKPRVSLASDDQVWTTGPARWSADSQLIVTRDLQIEADGERLPPCAQTPAVNPPCTGFASATAMAIAPQIVADGQAVQDAQTQLLDAQVWLHAFEVKLRHDRSVR